MQNRQAYSNVPIARAYPGRIWCLVMDSKHPMHPGIHSSSATIARLCISPSARWSGHQGRLSSSRQFEDAVLHAPHLRCAIRVCFGGKRFPQGLFCYCAPTRWGCGCRLLFGPLLVRCEKMLEWKDGLWGQSNPLKMSKGHRKRSPDHPVVHAAEIYALKCLWWPLRSSGRKRYYRASQY